MATPYSVDTLIDYSFRRLGAPVVDINVDRQQAEERINDALDFFSERHFDGVEKHYYAHKVTSADIGLVEDFFNTDKNFRFSKVTNRLYIDMDWSEDVDSGSYLLVETFATLNPNEFTEIYNDRLLKEYVTALLKRQWGSNLSKFEGVQLPGGVTLRGAELFTEANEEVQRIEEKVLLEYELPIDFTVG